MQIIVMERFAQVSLNTMNEKLKPSCRGKRKYFHQETTKKRDRLVWQKTAEEVISPSFYVLKKDPVLIAIDDV